MALSKRVVERIVQQVKKYQVILAEAKDRDISESDTVAIISDMIADILGYKKYIEITTEYAIRSTYVDLAVKVGEDLRFLIEAKAIGAQLKEAHVKQAIDYGANQGIDWVLLSNGVIWQIYKIYFKQPVEKALIYEIDFLNANIKNQQLIDCLGNLTREGFTQSSMAAFCQQQQISSKFSLAAILLSPPMLTSLRKEIRRISPTVKIDESQLKTTLQNDVLKREVVESDEAKQALDVLKKATRSALRQKAKTPTEVKIEPETASAPSLQCTDESIK